MADTIFPLYLEHLDAALENFCESHWPREHVDLDTGSRCVNVKSGHGEKGHQNANGKIFADGPYKTRRGFDTLQEEFRRNTYFRLDELLGILRDHLQNMPFPVAMCCVRNVSLYMVAGNRAAGQISRSNIVLWNHRRGEHRSHGRYI